MILTITKDINVVIIFLCVSLSMFYIKITIIAGQIWSPKTVSKSVTIQAYKVGKWVLVKRVEIKVEQIKQK